MVLDGNSVKQIHKKIYDMVHKMPKMYLFMEKVANRAYKSINHNKTKDENADFLLLLFAKSKYNSKARKLINHELTEEAEESKNIIINKYVKDSRNLERWFYLASSHNDCAKDHLPYQGKLYYDEKAPEEIIKYAKKHGLQSIQWVMGAPAWFITRPNCRHFFKSLPLNVVKRYSVKELTRRYKTHRKVGNKEFATPRKIALEQYEDRLRMLKAMYAQHPTENLRRMILKTEMLIKKWKNLL